MNTERRKLDRRIDKLEKDMKQLKSRVTKLENETANTTKHVRNLAKKIK